MSNPKKEACKCWDSNENTCVNLRSSFKKNPALMIDNFKAEDISYVKTKYKLVNEEICSASQNKELEEMKKKYDSTNEELQSLKNTIATNTSDIQLKKSKFSIKDLFFSKEEPEPTRLGVLRPNGS
jgi:hypothetical protein